VTLVLADNLLLLYLGWEGVGLCSYLLIGFWYTDPVNGLAARKAFIVTRVGDIAMAVGLFLLFTHLGTLQIQQLMSKAAEQWPVGSPYAVAAAALLLGGAVGKSAQLPLQTWLPDAMAGPTPTSALIHAATMVTAGVYLIARTHALYTLAPTVQFAVAVVGAATLLLAGFSALTQRDIKRVLAYSTISQIGYMFLALGVGAWSAAIFHFMTHAFFKALLFLAAGIVIQALHHEHDIFKMGGLRKELPVAFWTFLIGGCSLAGLPLITAGFYSKGLIIWETMASVRGGAGLWIAAIAGVLLTSLYTFRLIFLVFFGEPKSHVGERPGYVMTIPVLVLAFFSIVGGFVNTPAALGNVHAFSDLMNRALPPIAERAGLWPAEMGSEGLVTLAFVAGLFAAYFLFLRRPDYSAALTRPAVGRALHAFWFADWGFDWLYDKSLVRPILWIARIDKEDFVDALYTGVARTNEFFHRALSLTETGRVRWYAAGIAAGSIIFVAIAVLA
jgi:NADH-quinone oxidoreductase subunit L